jgi:hypothetical protein
MSLTIPDALHGVNIAESALETIHAAIPEMDEEQLVATYQRAGELGKRAWLVQAHCLWEARQRKTGHNDGVMADLARGFGITKQYAGQLCGAWVAVPEEKRFSSVDLPLSKSFYNVAGQTDDPQGWAAHAEDRKAENPAFSVRDFRAEIAAARIIDEETGEVFNGGDWTEAPTPFTPPVAVLPPAQFIHEIGEGPARTQAAQAQWYAIVACLFRAAREGAELIKHWEPVEVARQLPPDFDPGFAAVEPLVEFVSGVIAARHDGNASAIRRVK